MTGTRTRGLSAVASASPVDVVGAQALATRGLPGLTEALNALVPSFSLPAFAGNDASVVVRSATLRGLNADQTLVLVNGKRRHNSAILNIAGFLNNGSAPVDLDLIPESAIDHIEILRDGASAQYGSDAIAGVINIILKKTDHGGLVSVLGGGYGDGGGETALAQGSVGVPLGNGGHLQLSGDVRSHEHSSRAGLDRERIYFPLPDGSPDPREATTDRRKIQGFGDPESRTYDFAYDLALPLGASELYSFSTLSRREARNWFNYRAASSPNNVLSTYPDGYEPRLKITDSDFQFALGVRGDGLLGFRWDASSTFGRDYAAFSVDHSLNATLGAASPTRFADGALVYNQSTSNLDLSRDVAIAGFAKPLSVALGAEVRYEDYNIGAGEPASYENGGVAPSGPNAGAPAQAGSQGFGGFAPANAQGRGRTSEALYLDLETSPVKAWSIGVAGRVEHFSDFGESYTGKVSTLYQIAKGIAARASVNNAFRAPSLAQSLYSATTALFFPDATGHENLFEIRSLPVDSPAARALGAVPLRPEVSFNYGAGLVLQPLRALSVTADYYHIDIGRRIVQTGVLIGLSVSAALAAAGLDPGLGGSFFTNAVDTRTRGLDVTSTYRTPLRGDARIDWTLGFNWNDTAITRIAPNPAPLAASGLVLFDRQRQGDLTVGTPRTKLILGATAHAGRFSLTARTTRYGEVTRRDPVNPANDETAETKWIEDLEVSVPVSRRFTLSAGANNLFDISPTPEKPLNIPINGFGGPNPYSPFGISGGFYYGRLSATF